MCYISKADLTSLYYFLSSDLKVDAEFANLSSSAKPLTENAQFPSVMRWCREQFGESDPGGISVHKE